MSVCNGELSESQTSERSKERGVRFGSEDMEEEIVSVRNISITDAKPFGEDESEV
ncbi:hypothetical protein X975_15252, partial [Stegodyphus mimosarum]